MVWPWMFAGARAGGGMDFPGAAIDATWVGV